MAEDAWPSQECRERLSKVGWCRPSWLGERRVAHTRLRCRRWRGQRSKGATICRVASAFGVASEQCCASARCDTARGRDPERQPLHRAHTCATLERLARLPLKAIEYRSRRPRLVGSDRWTPHSLLAHPNQTAMCLSGRLPN